LSDIVSEPFGHEGPLLRQIIELLPVGLTLRSQDGRLILCNAAATPNVGSTERTITGHDGNLLPMRSGATRRAHDIVPLGEISRVEETAADGTAERTLWTSQRSVRINDETVVLSASVDITERKSIERELERLAYLDQLTGLPNRTSIELHINDLLHRSREDDRFAVAFVDLDNFKHVNDYYGHAIGDALLIEVAKRLSAVLRASDTPARISGDEFVLVLEPVESLHELSSLVNRVLQNIKRPFYIDNFEIFASASVGVSLFPEHGGSYDALRRNADYAMYRAKSGTKGCAAVFDTDMSKELSARMALEQRLRLAIHDRQFRCAFQPKVDIATDQVIGFEALVRLRDEAGVIDMPGSFIALAVELGLIDPITHFVLKASDAAFDQLDNAFGAHTTISINIAAKQASDRHFMDSFVEALKDTGRAERYMIEVTEEAFVAADAFQTRILPVLRGMGVGISIDDFGTGYSSLSRFAEISADEIKIDRSFITAIHRRPQNQSILKAIETLSHSVGMRMVAEGVETSEELEFLRTATKIEIAQGYYFARPFFIDDMGVVHRAVTNTRAVQVARPAWDMPRACAANSRAW
jgi:cyclic di-GMP phosphodiesterase Gmr